jgi:hypothetical protein
MAGLMSMLKKTFRKGTNAVRGVGRFSRKTLRRGTNLVGLTKRRKTRGKARKGRKSSRKSQQ